MSTSTGMVAASTTSPKSASDRSPPRAVVSGIFRSGAPHARQRNAVLGLTVRTDDDLRRVFDARAHAASLSSGGPLRDITVSSPSTRSTKTSPPSRKITPQQRSPDPRLNLAGNEAPQRSGAVRRVEPLLGNEPQRRFGDHQADPALCKPGSQVVEEQVHDQLDLTKGEGLKSTISSTRFKNSGGKWLRSAPSTSGAHPP